VAALIYILTNNVEEFPCLYVQASSSYSCLLKIIVINFLLGYIHDTEGFVVVILYIIYIAPWSHPLSPLPTPLQAIARGFLLLFHIGI
jgi:ABC-type iron transport system FetAB permease component